MALLEWYRSPKASVSRQMHAKQKRESANMNEKNRKHSKMTHTAFIPDICSPTSIRKKSMKNSLRLAPVMLKWPLYQTTNCWCLSFRRPPRADLLSPTPSKLSEGVNIHNIAGKQQLPDIWASASA